METWIDSSQKVCALTKRNSALVIPSLREKEKLLVMSNYIALAESVDRYY